MLKKITKWDKLKKRLDDKNFATSDFYIGGRKQKDLDEAEKCQILLGTFSMASEALDIPDLNTLIMVTPRRNIEQSVGRILRRKDHPVQPLIVDIVDQLKSFVKQGMARRDFYRKNKYQLKLIDVEDNIIHSEEDITDKSEKKRLYIPVNNDDH